MPEDRWSTNELDARLALIVDYAPKLRAAGITHFAIAGMSVSLLPAEPAPAPAPIVAHEDPIEEPKSLLDDPESYGLPEGAEVPGFRRPEELRKA